MPGNSLSRETRLSGAGSAFLREWPGIRRGERRRTKPAPSVIIAGRKTFSVSIRTAPCLVDPKALTRARKAAGLSITDAGRAAGVPRASVAAWEAGETLPTVRQLGRLARAYGRPAETLLVQPAA